MGDVCRGVRLGTKQWNQSERLLTLLPTCHPQGWGSSLCKGPGVWKSHDISPTGWCEIQQTAVALWWSSGLPSGGHWALGVSLLSAQAGRPQFLQKTSQCLCLSEEHYHLGSKEEDLSLLILPVFASQPEGLRAEAGPCEQNCLRARPCWPMVMDHDTASPHPQSCLWVLSRRTPGGSSLACGWGCNRRAPGFPVGSFLLLLPPLLGHVGWGKVGNG